MKWAVPRADLAAQYRALASEIDGAITETLSRAELIRGPTLRRFEAAVADRIGVAEAVGTSSGTAALTLALEAIGVAGGEVIVPAFTFAATAAAVVHARATPVFADVDEASFCIDPTDVARRMTPRTKALVAVHLFGRAAPVRALGQFGVPIVEDAAQAFGARGPEGMVGSLGAFGCFSFHPAKNLGVAGDGGMITTDDREAAARIRTLLDHGRDACGRHVVAGYNHRLDAIQAAVGLVKLAHVDMWNDRRRELAGHYDEGLRDTDLRRPELTPGHVFNQYAVLTAARDALAEHLARDGIASARFYERALYDEPAFADVRPEVPCAVAEDLSRRTLCLPLYPELSNAQQRKVVASIHRFHE